MEIFLRKGNFSQEISGELSGFFLREIFAEVFITGEMFWGDVQGQDYKWLRVVVTILRHPG